MAENRPNEEKTMEELGNEFDRIAGFELTGKQKDTILKTIIVDFLKPSKTDSIFTTKNDKNFEIFAKEDPKNLNADVIKSLEEISPHLAGYEKIHRQNITHYNSTFKATLKSYYDELNTQDNLMNWFTTDEWYTEPKRIKFKRDILQRVEAMDLRKDDLLLMIQGAMDYLMPEADILKNKIEGTDSKKHCIAALNTFVPPADATELLRHNNIAGLDLLSELDSSKESIFNEMEGNETIPIPRIPIGSLSLNLLPASGTIPSHLELSNALETTIEVSFRRISTIPSLDYFYDGSTLTFKADGENPVFLTNLSNDNLTNALNQNTGDNFRFELGYSNSFKNYGGSAEYFSKYPLLATRTPKWSCLNGGYEEPHCTLDILLQLPHYENLFFSRTRSQFLLKINTDEGLDYDPDFFGGKANPNYIQNIKNEIDRFAKNLSKKVAINHNITFLKLPLAIVMAYNLRKRDKIINGCHDNGALYFPFSQKNKFSVSLKNDKNMRNGYLSFLNLMAVRPPCVTAEMTNPTAALENLSETTIFNDSPEARVVMENCWFSDNGLALRGTAEEDDEMCRLASMNDELSLRRILTNVTTLIAEKHILLGNMDTVTDAEFRDVQMRKLCIPGAFNANCINNWQAGFQSTASYGDWFGYLDQQYAKGVIESARSPIPTQSNHISQAKFLKNFDHAVKQSAITTLNAMRARNRETDTSKATKNVGSSSTHNDDAGRHMNMAEPRKWDGQALNQLQQDAAMVSKTPLPPEYTSTNNLQNIQPMGVMNPNIDGGSGNLYPSLETNLIDFQSNNQSTTRNALPQFRVQTFVSRQTLQNEMEAATTTAPAPTHNKEVSPTSRFFAVPGKTGNASGPRPTVTVSATLGAGGPSLSATPTSCPASGGGPPGSGPPGGGSSGGGGAPSGSNPSGSGGSPGGNPFGGGPGRGGPPDPSGPGGPPGGMPGDPRNGSYGDRILELARKTSRSMIKNRKHHMAEAGKSFISARNVQREMFEAETKITAGLDIVSFRMRTNHPVPNGPSNQDAWLFTKGIETIDFIRTVITTRLQTPTSTNARSTAYSKGPAQPIVTEVNEINRLPGSFVDLTAEDGEAKRQEIFDRIKDEISAYTNPVTTEVIEDRENLHLSMVMSEFFQTENIVLGGLHDKALNNIGSYQGRYKKFVNPEHNKSYEPELQQHSEDTDILKMSLIARNCTIINNLCNRNEYATISKVAKVWDGSRGKLFIHILKQIREVRQTMNSMNIMSSDPSNAWNYLSSWIRLVENMLPEELKKIRQKVLQSEIRQYPNKPRPTTLRTTIEELCRMVDTSVELSCANFKTDMVRHITSEAPKHSLALNFIVESKFLMEAAYGKRIEDLSDVLSPATHSEYSNCLKNCLTHRNFAHELDSFFLLNLEHKLEGYTIQLNVTEVFVPVQLTFMVIEEELIKWRSKHKSCAAKFNRNATLTMNSKNKVTQQKKHATAVAHNNNAVKIKCNFCSRLGHKSPECWSNPKGKNYNPNANSIKEIICSFCKKVGHKASGCRSNPSNQWSAQEKQIICNYCSRKGHKSPDCWANPNNKQKTNGKGQNGNQQRGNFNNNTNGSKQSGKGKRNNGDRGSGNFSGGAKNGHKGLGNNDHHKHIKPRSFGNPGSCTVCYKVAHQPWDCNKRTKLKEFKDGHLPSLDNCKMCNVSAHRTRFCPRTNMLNMTKSEWLKKFIECQARRDIPALGRYKEPDEAYTWELNHLGYKVGGWNEKPSKKLGNKKIEAIKQTCNAVAKTGSTMNNAATKANLSEEACLMMCPKPNHKTALCASFDATRMSQEAWIGRVKEVNPTYRSKADSELVEMYDRVKKSSQKHRERENRYFKSHSAPTKPPHNAVLAVKPSFPISNIEFWKTNGISEEPTADFIRNQKERIMIIPVTTQEKRRMPAEHESATKGQYKNNHNKKREQADKKHARTHTTKKMCFPKNSKSPARCFFKNIWLDTKNTKIFSKILKNSGKFNLLKQDKTSKISKKSCFPWEKLILKKSGIFGIFRTKSQNYNNFHTRGARSNEADLKNVCLTISDSTSENLDLEILQTRDSMSNDPGKENRFDKITCKPCPLELDGTQLAIFSGRILQSPGNELVLMYDSGNCGENSVLDFDTYRQILDNTKLKATKPNENLIGIGGETPVYGLVHLDVQFGTRTHLKLPLVLSDVKESTGVDIILSGRIMGSLYESITINCPKRLMTLTYQAPYQKRNLLEIRKHKSMRVNLLTPTEQHNIIDRSRSQDRPLLLKQKGSISYVVANENFQIPPDSTLLLKNGIIRLEKNEPPDPSLNVIIDPIIDNNEESDLGTFNEGHFDPRIKSDLSELGEKEVETIKQQHLGAAVVGPSLCKQNELCMYISNNNSKCTQITKGQKLAIGTISENINLADAKSFEEFSEMQNKQFSQMIKDYDGPKFTEKELAKNNNFLKQNLEKSKSAICRLTSRSNAKRTMEDIEKMVQNRRDWYRNEVDSEKPTLVTVPKGSENTKKIEIGKPNARVKFIVGKEWTPNHMKMLEKILENNFECFCPPKLRKAINVPPANVRLRPNYREFLNPKPFDRQLNPQALRDLSAALEPMIEAGQVVPINECVDNIIPVFLASKSPKIDPDTSRLAKASRVILDCRALNRCIEGVIAPFVSANDINTMLAGAKVVSVVDVVGAYDVLSLSAEFSKFVNFNIMNQTFRSYGLPQGMSASGYYCMSTLNSLISSIIFKHGETFCIAYADDLILVSKGANTLDTHLECFAQLIAKLDSHKLSVSAKKACLGVLQCTYLGKTICMNDGMTHKWISNRHREGLNCLKCPTTSSEALSFIGSANFYLSFVPFFSDRVKAMLDEYIRAKRDSNSFRVTEAVKKSFELTKMALLQCSVVGIPDCPSEEITLYIYSDSSGYAISGLLGFVFNNDKNKRHHLVECFSKKHSPSASRSSSPALLEMAALSSVVSHFLPFICSYKTVICIDNKWCHDLWNNPKAKNSPLASIRIQYLRANVPSNTKMILVQTDKNVSDWVSRCVKMTGFEGPRELEYYDGVLETIPKIEQAIHGQRKTVNTSSEQNSAREKRLEQRNLRQETADLIDFSEGDSMGINFDENSMLRDRAISDVENANTAYLDNVDVVRTETEEKQMDLDLENVISKFKFTPRDVDLIDIHRQLGCCSAKQLHKILQTEYQNTEVTFQACVRSIAACPSCNSFPLTYPKLKVAGTSIPLSLLPNNVILTDYGEIYKKCVHNKTSFMVIACSFSRYTAAFATSGNTMRETCRVLDLWTSLLGLPRLIQADKGTSFTGGDVARWAKRRNIGLKFCETDAHMSNSLAELGVKFVKSHLKRKTFDYSNENTEFNTPIPCWCELVPSSTAVHNAVKKRYIRDGSDEPVYLSPANLMFGDDRRTLHHPISLSEKMNPYQRIEIDVQAVLETRAREAKYRQKNKKETLEYQKGDLVVLTNAIAAVSKNRKHITYNNFYRVLGIDGHCVELCEIGRNGLLSNNGFTIHSSFCRLANQTTFDSLTNSNTLNPQKLIDSVDARFKKKIM